MDAFERTEEESENAEKIERYFGSYSDGIRKQLLSKNLPRPTNLYDILYPQVRKDLLSRNKSNFNVDLDESSKIIREQLLARQIKSNVTISSNSETLRNNLLSKNDLLQTSLNTSSLAIRNNLINKNVDNNSDLSKSSAQSRNNLLNRNVDDNSNLSKDSTPIRNNILNKNVVDNSDLNSDSVTTRNSLLNKNVSDTSDLNKDSITTRNTSLNKNTKDNSDLSKSSVQTRENLLNKNIVDISNLHKDSSQTRDNLLNKNIIDASNLSKDSTDTRNNILNKNVVDNSDLKQESLATRNTLLNKNVTDTSDLSKDSVTTRNNILNKNIADTSDLSKDSVTTRDILLNKNVADTSDLGKDSVTTRDNLLNKNIADNFNLSKDSIATRNNILKSNVPDTSDLNKDSVTTRNNILKSNVPDNSDLSKDSVTARNAILKSNVPDTSDLSKDSVVTRDILLNKNVPDTSNLNKDSVATRNSLLASNLPDPFDLKTDSVTYRNNLLKSNLPDPFDIKTDSVVPRNALLSKNLPDPFDLKKDSVAYRNSLLASNLPDPFDLKKDSVVIRNSLLSKNLPDPFDLKTDSVVARNILLSKNINSQSDLENDSSAFRHDLLSRNDQVDPLGGAFGSVVGSVFGVNLSPLAVSGLIYRTEALLLDKIFNLIGNTGGPTLFDINNAVTSAALVMNVKNNLYALDSTLYDASIAKGIGTILNPNFVDPLLVVGGLIAKPPGANKAGETNTTPLGIIQANKGQYLPQPAEKILKSIDGAIGTAESMMSQTTPSDALSRAFYANAPNKIERGIRHIMNTIKKSESPLAKNFDPQNKNTYWIGTDEKGQPVKAYSRYTINNPYQPNKDAGTLELLITNYAMPDQNGKKGSSMSFPPYIKSFQNSDSAEWNSTTFLGRPEPIFTYSNSKRTGTISFIVLTDYATKVTAGYSYQNKTPIDIIFPKDFTTTNSSSDDILTAASNISDKQLQIQTLTSQLSSIGTTDVSGIANITSKIASLNLEINAQQATLTAAQNKNQLTTNNRTYSETTKQQGNIYKDILQGQKTYTQNRDTEYVPEDTVARLNNMAQNLMFQPAYFSGDKVDFINRMDFIAKLTRPARNTSTGSGSLFTKPPVCHLTLGDFFNQDIIINSVSYSYDESLWTSDGLNSRMQPLMCNVTLDFNMIGQWQNAGVTGTDTFLASDIGGVFNAMQH